MHPSATYTTCATSSREQTGNIIPFAQFEEGDLLSETRNNAESGGKSDDDSIIPTLLSEYEIDAMDSRYESDDEYRSTEMLEETRDRSQSHPNVNRRKHVIKYMIVLSKNNRNGKKR